jgi:flagellar biosynthesis GTPase FlhF
MKNIVKKIMVYSLAGIMQVGLGSAVVAASPLYNDSPQRIVQLDDRYDHDRHDEERHRQVERRREENERHEREMRRRNHESEREWHERQRQENERHDNTIHEIEAGILGFILGSVSN